MRHARFASFAAGVVTMLVVGTAVTGVTSRRILFSLFVGISAVVIGALTTAVTTRS